MTTTDVPSKPIPTTIAELRAGWLPAEPDTSVTVARQAIGRIDGVIAHVRAELTNRDEQDHAFVVELIDAAMVGDDLDQLAGRFGPGDVPVLTRRLELLRDARNLASHRLTTAEHSDEQYVAWRQKCQDIEHSWQLANTGESAAEQVANLARWVAEH